jgi:hypothetical protein
MPMQLGRVLFKDTARFPGGFKKTDHFDGMMVATSHIR